MFLILLFSILTLAYALGAYANTNAFPVYLSTDLPNVACTVAEDTITFITGDTAYQLGVGLGSIASGGLFRSKTVGRRIQIIGDAAWSYSFTSKAQAAKNQVVANQSVTIELVQESQQIFIQTASGTSNLRLTVVA